ncbi:MAG: hypothetical protein ACRD1B_09045 [Thermoanaerobaculia bacterium]
MKRKTLLWAVPLVVAGLTACTNKEGSSEAPVTITVELKERPLIVSVQNPAPVQLTTINLLSNFKRSNVSDPHGFATVQLSYYTVVYSRRDGGVRVPPPEQFGTGVVLPAGGTAALTNYPVMKASSIQLSPFDQLLPFNGGIDRETGLNEIHIFYQVTFFGNTVSGQRVQSETATADLFFQ